MASVEPMPQERERPVPRWPSHAGASSADRGTQPRCGTYHQRRACVHALVAPRSSLRVSIAPAVATPPPQDEKLMLFLRRLPDDWRLFWLLEAMSISFWLALVGIIYLGKLESVSPALGNEDFTVGDVLHPYFVWVFTPGTLTMLALVLNDLMTRMTGTDPKASQASVLPATLESLERGHPSRYLRRNLGLVSALTGWLVVGSAYGVAIILQGYIPSVADRIITSSWIVIGACFLAGSARLALNAYDTRLRESRARWYRLLVGWGIGAGIGSFVVTSLRISEWIAFACGIVLFSLGILMFAEPRVLGMTVGSWIEAPVRFLRARDSVLNWSVACSVHFLMATWAGELALYVLKRVIV